MPLDYRTVVQFAAVRRHRWLFRPRRNGRKRNDSNISSWPDSFVTLNPRYVNMADINFSKPPSDPDSREPELARRPGPAIRAGTSSSCCSSPTAISSATPTMSWRRSASAAPTIGCCISSTAIPASRLPICWTCCASPSSRSAGCSSNCSTRATSCRRPATTIAGSAFFSPPPRAKRWSAKLARLQTDRINRALAGHRRPTAPRPCRQFLRGMIDHDDPDKVLDSILGAGSGNRKGVSCDPGCDHRRKNAAAPGRRRAASAAGRRRPPDPRSAVALSRRRRLSRHHREERQRRPRQAARPAFRSPDPRRDDARRDRVRSGALHPHLVPRCRSSC